MAPETTKATRGARPVDHAGRWTSQVVEKSTSMPNAECCLTEPTVFWHSALHIWHWRRFTALHASRAGELPRLETLAAEDRTPLRGTERHRCFLAARRAVGRRFNAFAANRRAATSRTRCALGFAALAAFRLIFEIFVGEEQLLAGGPDKRGPTVHAGQSLVKELHRNLSRSPQGPPRTAGCRGQARRHTRDPLHRVSQHPAHSLSLLVRFAALLLARPLPRQRLLGAAPIARFQVEGVLLDILDDIFLLHLPLEPAKRALDGLAILHFHFSQA
jgi:hypothetical protein